MSIERRIIGSLTDLESNLISATLPVSSQEQQEQQQEENQEKEQKS